MKNTHKNLSNFIFTLAIITFVSVGCGRFSNQYEQSGCQIEGAEKPKTALDYINRAMRHKEKAQKDCQFYACQQAVSLDAKNSDAYSCRGQAIYEYKNNPAQAIADLTTAIELQPKFDYFEQRAGIYEKENQPEKALADYEKCFEFGRIPAEKSYAKSSIAQIYLTQNKLDLALSAINEAINLSPDFDLNYFLRAELYNKQGKTELAEADSRKAIVLKYQNGDSPKTKTVEVKILNNKAIKLLQPSTPTIAKESGAFGEVKVHVVLDEAGKVTFAEAFSGPTALYRAAQNAVMASKFPPIIVDGKPASVTGIVIYNFPKQ